LAQVEVPVVLEVSRLLLVEVVTRLVVLGEEPTQVLVVQAVRVLLDKVILAALLLQRHQEEQALAVVEQVL
jgi:2-C-methyl-D-erythritol 4-phosphate cytidylyltransferase